MADAKKEKLEGSTRGVDGLYSTLEWMISAFCYTLAFIVFEMQAYTIPTGSMADTLKGAHFRLRCEQCAYSYDYDFLPDPYQLQRNQTPGVNVELLTRGPDGRPMPDHPRCPNCGYYRQTGQKMPVVNGDRIFVLKSIYQFIEPKRWDVVVFKNPTNPGENYIKRMIAGPGETLEIIDGDITINGQIARKPPKVQDELWMPVYDNDYQPAQPGDPYFNRHAWSQPFRNAGSSAWNLAAEGPTVFALADEGPQIHRIEYDTTVGNDFRATYAYDDPRAFPYMPICSDLRIQFDATLEPSSMVAAQLSKYGVPYRASVGGDGSIRIERTTPGGAVETLVDDEIPGGIHEPLSISFANSDHRLRLTVAGREWIYDFPSEPGSMGKPKAEMPIVAIEGSGAIRLSHVRLWRDIHYVFGPRAARASEGRPFTLGADEFFVCGDNSPNSADARVWTSPGLGNGKEYRAGTVPRDFLVGKAFFVYWPGPYRPWNGTGLADSMDRSPLGRIAKILMNVPWVDGIKIIYGGHEPLTPYTPSKPVAHDE
jgi:signal peptidase I